MHRSPSRQRHALIAVFSQRDQRMRAIDVAFTGCREALFLLGTIVGNHCRAFAGYPTVSFGDAWYGGW